jgi:hypothetical protein
MFIKTEFLVCLEVNNGYKLGFDTQDFDVDTRSFYIQIFSL